MAAHEVTPALSLSSPSLAGGQQNRMRTSLESSLYVEPALPREFINKQHDPLQPVNHARQHRGSILHHEEHGYEVYKQHRDVALGVAVSQRAHTWFSCCILDGHAIDCLAIQNKGLTIGLDRQSKLSKEELDQLQKATHFDKKELQQWYKGMYEPAC
jgi:hypothetical protein